MRGFFKMFFASFVAIIVFVALFFFAIVGIVGSLASKSTPDVPAKSILVIDLNKTFHEKQRTNALAALSDEGADPGLYDVIRLVNKAKTDADIAGIYIEADNNLNGFASSTELRNALLDFRTSKKFVIAHGDVMEQGAYYVASAADKVYINPSGNFEWKGFAVTLFFVKEMLDKLNIQPEIFYAGKYKSATEIFRTTQMTPENKVQTVAWLGDIYNYFLVECGKARNIDTATLHQLANNASIQKPEDALSNKLVDGLKYDDEIKTEIKQKLGIGKTDKMNFISINKYNQASNIKKTGTDRIALIYAEGDIVDGDGSNDNIGGSHFRDMIRKARLDNTVKAIVMRVNSGGGSALASENIWRELQMARADGKPVVVSFGDVAASGGYYISCGADSIFASPNTITGSIGVLAVTANMGNFFKEKLGVTFDGVKTAPYADAPNIYREMNANEKQQMQSGVDRTYAQFKARVAAGRKKDTAYIDSIAQGRVWSGMAGLQNGLVDRIGGLQDAINSGAKLAKLASGYGVKEYPEDQGILDNLLNRRKEEPAAMIREQMGEEYFRVYTEMIRIREMSNSIQARLPYQFFVR